MKLRMKLWMIVASTQRYEQQIDNCASETKKQKCKQYQDKIESNFVSHLGFNLKGLREVESRYFRQKFKEKSYWTLCQLSKQPQSKVSLVSLPKASY